jgi:predicted DNA-binding transcriptional regulator AlpA
MAERELLDEREVEMRYNIKRSTQRAWRAQRRIPYIKLGGRLVRYRVSDLESFIEGSLVRAGTPSHGRANGHQQDD